MYGAPNGNDETRRLREELARLQRERGQAAGMVQILQGKLAEVEEDNFDLRANMMTIEAEIKYESKKSEEVMQKQVSSLESKLSFLNEQLKNADRVKLRALRELEELQQKQLLEQKRLDAEKRLLATKKRKHESALYAASQTIMTRMSQIDRAPPATVLSSKHIGSMSEMEVQTDPPNERERLAAENAELAAKLMSTASRDLLILFKGSSELDVTGTKDEDGAPNGEHSAPQDPDSHGSESRASQSGHTGDSAGGSAATVAFSQSVFSQLAGHAHAQARATRLSFTQGINLTQAAYVNERSKDLHDALATMIQGDATTLALAPVFVRYLAAPTDLDTHVLCSVLRVMYLVMVHSECFQAFLLLSSTSSATSDNLHAATKSGSESSTMEHPRISFPGLRFASLDDYLASRKDDTSHSRREMLSTQAQEQQLAEQMQLRAKLLSALCRVIRNNMNDASVVENGLSVLSLWIDLGVMHRTPHADFRAIISSNVIQELVLAPKGVAIKLKTKALTVFLDLIHFQDMFPEIEASARRSRLFNRCAKLLSRTTTVAPSNAVLYHEAISDLRSLQLVVIRLFLAIVTTYPSMGVRFVLESTRGSPADDDRELSVIFHLAQLLQRETFDARTLGLDALEELLADPARMTLIQDAFTLLSLLVRYVDLSRELGGPHLEYSFLSVLYLLSSSKFDAPKNDTISKVAVALVALVQPLQQ